MNNNISVSVVIPAYNCRAFIKEAIDSVLGQAFANCEIIVVDDGSTDGTGEIVKSYKEKVKYIYQENRGVAAARNRGIQEAKGEWIAFLDADDAMLPWRLSTQVDTAMKHPEAVLVCGRVTSFEENGERMEAEAKIITRNIPLEEFVAENPVGTSSVMARKKAIISAGGFDTSFNGPEDYDLWMRIAACGSILFMDIPLSRYRLRSGSLSMDDRSFLPQVMKVINKAFSKTGVLKGYVELKKQAIANQYFHASWMAFNRGSRFTAVRYLLASCLGILGKGRCSQNFPRLELLWRYLFGKRPGR